MKRGIFGGGSFIKLYVNYSIDLLGWKCFLPTYKEHNVKKRIPPQSYIVDGLFVEKHFSLLIGQSSAGKSLFLNWLAICLTFGLDFLGLPTKPSSVLCIDQDSGGISPKTGLVEGVTAERLYKFGLSVGSRKRRKKFYLEIQGYELGGNKFKKLAKRKGIDALLIDSLHSICGTCDPNSSRDMDRLKALKMLLSDFTVVLTHHISDKGDSKNLGYDDVMRMDNVIPLSMGSSVITQTVDAVIALVPEKNTDGDITTLYINPQGKRSLLDNRPFTTSLLSNENSLRFGEHSLYVEPLAFTRSERFVLAYFKDEDASSLNVRHLYSELGETISKDSLRKALNALKDKKLVECDQSLNRDYKWSLVRKKKRGKKLRRKKR